MRIIRVRARVKYSLRISRQLANLLREGHFILLSNFVYYLSQKGYFVNRL